MNAKEREAFEKSYNENVAIGDKEDVSKFLDRYYSDDDSVTYSVLDGDALHKDFPEIYSTVVDHICTWNSAKEYFKSTLFENSV